jgi:hypothetical protein
MVNQTLSVVMSSVVIIVIGAVVLGGAIPKVEGAFGTADKASPDEDEFDSPWSGGTGTGPSTGGGSGTSSGGGSGSGSGGGSLAPPATSGENVKLRNPKVKTSGNKFSVKTTVEVTGDGEHNGFIFANKDIDCSKEIETESLTLNRKEKCGKTSTSKTCKATDIQYGNTGDNTLILLAASTRDSVFSSGELTLNEREPASYICINKP